jgi:DNA-binding transcriptional MerR regulator
MEVCQKTGISRPTLFRWLKTGILEKSYKSHRGWRIFTEEDLNQIRMEARKIKVEYVYRESNNDKK